MTTQAIAHDPIRRPNLRVSEGASTALLLVLLMLSVTGSVNAANWADGLSTMVWAALGGLAFGILMAKLPLRGWLAHPLMVIFGLGATALLASSLIPGDLTLKERLIALQERIMVWYLKAVTGGVSTDNLMFVIQLIILGWVMAYLAAWFVYRRHQVWGALLPSGVGILFNLFYAAPQTGVYLVLFTLSALLLLVRVNLHGMERWWRRASIGYAGDISFDFLLYGVVFSLLLVTLAWLLPSSAPGPSWFSAFEPLQEPWQNLEDQFNRVFSSLRAVARPSSTNFVGTTLIMGGPVNLGQRPVMDVTSTAGRYWRASVYDKYTGNGWMNTHLDPANLGANDSRLAASPDALRAVVTQTFQIYLPDQQNIIYAESQPVQFNIPTEIRYGKDTSTTANAPAVDVAVIRARRPLQKGDTYTVISEISMADEESLRAAPAQYTEWMTKTYLQLPQNLPDRVRRLAQQITAGDSNNYDKAVAIEQYLRTHIRYNDAVSAPPDGRDAVDYTLFDRPEGYCNYYASAMAVLARAVGIPARVVSGYSMGEYKDGIFHVVEANAHSWPELYFPYYGWIEFEPTSSKPEIERPKKTDVTADTQDPSSEAERLRRSRQDRLDELDQGLTPGSAFSSFENSFWSEPTTVAATGGGLVLLLAAGTVSVLSWRRNRRAARLAPAARIYGDLLTRARWLGIPDPACNTPYERAHALGEALPEAKNEIHFATSLYVRERFGARPLDEGERNALSEAWTKVYLAWRRGVVVLLIRRLLDPPRKLILQARSGIERLVHRSGREQFPP